MIQFLQTQIGYKTSLLNLNIDSLMEGQCYAIIGSNGVGKSTFLKTLGGQVSCFYGDILIDKISIKQLSPKLIARQIAFVPSKFPDADYLKVRDFIALGRTPYINQFGQLTVGDNQLIDQTMSQLNIDHLETKMTTELSDGERQLCAVARALVQQTKILILDEPTSFLDYRNKRRMIEQLINITKERNLVTIFSTHDLDSLNNFNVQKIGIQANNHLPRITEFINESLEIQQLIEKYYF